MKDFSVSLPHSGLFGVMVKNLAVDLYVEGSKAHKYLFYFKYFLSSE